MIPDICLIEAAYPIFRAKGAHELTKYATFVNNLPVAPGVKLYKTTPEDLSEAMTLISSHSELFIDVEGNLGLFDALIASIWLRTKMPLVTKDVNLIKLSEMREELKEKVIVLEKSARYAR